MIDAETEAIAALNARMHRVTTAVVLLLTPLSVAIAVAVYVGIYARVPSSKISVAIAAAVAITFLQRSARALRRVLIRARTPSWVSALALKWRVERARLEEVTSLWKLD
jgi:hypothetical protein